MLQESPGKKAVFKRGKKYPERIINNSKSVISIMFAGTASGKLLVPYVVYKGESLWNVWIQNGPHGVRYNRTHSGWFDTTCFEDWYMTIA